MIKSDFFVVFKEAVHHVARWIGLRPKSSGVADFSPHPFLFPK